MSILTLASASPRRREILTMLGIAHEIRPSIYMEEDDETLKEHHEMAKIHAQCKAQDVFARLEDPGPVLAADTIVVLAEQRMGKPENSLDAVRMLELLSGQTHQVITGLCLVLSNTEIFSDCQITNVTFRKLTKHEIMEYVETGEPLDKAGAYGIQGIASVFVNRIEGCFFNIVGLPVGLLTEMFRKAGMNCPDWNNIRSQTGK